MIKNLKSLSDLISLKRKRALITGSAIGIGRAIACRFAEAGADLELVDINRDGLRALKNELSRLESEITTHRTDLSKKEEINALWEKLEEKEPDILVNNASIYPLRDSRDIDAPFLERIIDINLKSALWMSQQMINRRLKSGGVIINIGTIEALLPSARDLTSYSVNKAGIISLTRSLARKYGKYGFRINVIIPGGVITHGTKGATGEVAKFKVDLLKLGCDYKQRLPMIRTGQPDDVARIALVLASDLASYVHGALIPVDGGFLLS